MQRTENAAPPAEIHALVLIGRDPEMIGPITADSEMPARFSLSDVARFVGLTKSETKAAERENINPSPDNACKGLEREE